MNALDVFFLIASAAMILSGLRAILLRRLSLQGHIAGRQYSRSVDGWRAVAGGLAWIVVGAGFLLMHFRK